MKLVVDRRLREDEEGQLADYFTDNFRHRFSYKFQYVDEIPRTPGGKFESFMSALDG